MFRVVPGRFPVAKSKPTISLIILLLPALGLPVKTKYSSSILIVIGKESDLLIPFTHVVYMPFPGPSCSQDSFYSIQVLGFSWFLIGILTWTLFVTWLVIIQASGNAVRIRPFESVKEYYEPATTLTLKTSFTVTLLVAWISPFMLFWSVIPPDPIYRQAATTFLAATLVVTIPIIITSFFLPALKIHKGMEESRKRALVYKRFQLEDLKESEELDLDKYLKIQKHLMDDYKDIQKNPEWVLNIPQMMEIAGTILLPIVTFLISISL